MAMQFNVSPRVGGDWDQGAVETWAACLGAYLVFEVVTLALFWLRRRTRPIEARPVGLTMLQSVGGFVFAVVTVDNYYLENVPCFVNMWLLNLASTTFATAQVLRAISLYTKYRVNQATVLGLFTSHDNASTTTSSGPATKLSASDLCPIPLTLPCNPTLKTDPMLRSNSTPPGPGLSPSTSSPGTEASPASPGGALPYAYPTENLSSDRADKMWRQRCGCGGGSTTLMDDTVDRWLCKRTRGVTDRTWILALVAMEAAVVVYLIAAQSLTKKFRIYPVMDMNRCVFSPLEYAFMYMYSTLVFIIVNPLLIWLLSGVREPHHMVADLITTIAWTTAIAIVQAVVGSAWVYAEV
ncbi:hypothetical protein HK101_005095, partial [Irineochytrium annulatum]